MLFALETSIPTTFIFISIFPPTISFAMAMPSFSRRRFYLFADPSAWLYLQKSNAANRRMVD